MGMEQQNLRHMKQALALALVWLNTPAFSQTALQPDETYGVVTVRVTDYAGKLRAGEEISFYGLAGKHTFSGITDTNGEFEIRLPKGDTYRILVSAIGEQQEYSTLKIPGGPGLYSGALVVKFELPAQITLEDVLFETGSAKLDPSSYPSLNRLATFMQRKKTLVLEIAGHTDNVGSDDANLTLSRQRAEAVRNYLVNQGVSGTRLAAKGYGSHEPVADNHTEQGRRQNRRTEVRIIKE